MGDNAVGPVTGQLGFHSVEPVTEPTSTREGPANATKGSGDNIRTIFPSPLFSTADDIVKKLGAPKVQVPPAVLLEEGRINKEYFGVVAAKAGPYITNDPPSFEHDYAEDRIQRCCKTQEIAQAVHDEMAGADGGAKEEALKSYVGQTGKVVAFLPTIGYMNLPGPPGECGGNMICNGAIVLTEDRIILFGSNSSKTASASDYVAGTTYCTALCCYMPCCKGFCGCFQCCRMTTYKYKQLASRENEDFSDHINLSNAKVSVKKSSTTQLMREYAPGKLPGDKCNCCAVCCKILCCKCIDCSSCFYHGSHEFAYADDGNQANSMTIESKIEKTVGHDDMAWSIMDELTLASLLTDSKTKYFAEDPTSDDSRALLLKKFGTKFSPADCVKKVQDLQSGLKTKDLCTSKNFTTVRITHWDAASQKIRTTVCVCDPIKVKSEDLMKFHVDASATPKNTMSDGLHSARGAEIGLDASASAWNMSGGGGGGGGLRGTASQSLKILGNVAGNLFKMLSGSSG